MYISVDIETNGPIPGRYSMLSIGAVAVDKPLEGFHRGENLVNTYYSTIKPISDKYVPEAIAVTGFNMEDAWHFKSPVLVMREFEAWLNSLGSSRIRFISDNAGFDWSFVNYYFHYYLEHNPFGFSCDSLTSIYKGIDKKTNASFKYLRPKGMKNHHALDDARANAVVIQKLDAKYPSMRLIRLPKMESPATI